MNADIILRSLKKDVSLIDESIQDWWLNYLHEHFNRYLETLSVLFKLGLHGKILDVGSVPGHFTVLLKRLGYNVVGVDINPKRCMKYFQKYNLKVEKVDIETEKLPFQDNSFDFVLFMEMLEHLRINPLFALREIYRVLKSPGYMVLTTPNITLPMRISFLLGKSYQGNPAEEFAKLDRIGHMGHIRLYTLHEIRQLLEFSGFKVEYFMHLGKTKGGWKTKLLRLLYPKQREFKPYLCVISSPNKPPKL
ncbi:MAG: class I SAM-dependent methyltransferase [Candidatus Baldrarchaeia archaeon]